MESGASLAPPRREPLPADTDVAKDFATTASSTVPDKSLKRKRNRFKVSCIPCQKRKTRCDQEEPCGACVKRSVGHECCVDDLLGAGVNLPSDLAQEVNALKRRVAKLEKRINDASKSERGVESLHQGADDAASVTEIARSFGEEVYRQAEVVSTLAGNLTSNLEPNGDSALPEIAPIPFERSGSNRNIDDETQYAVAAIEALALSKEPFAVLGSASMLPFSKAVPIDEGEHPASPYQPEAGSYTSIFVRDGYESSEPSILRMGLANKQESLLLYLPEESVSNSLVDWFLDEIGWLYNLLHRPTFLDECRQLWSHVQKRKAHCKVDPAWMAGYYMVLAWSVSLLNSSVDLPGPLASLPRSQVLELPQVWLNAYNEALAASEWADRPQARVVQAVLLRACYRQPYSTRQSNSYFYVWLSIAIRNCQLMGLHRLGSDQQTMPKDDPAWPQQSCALKRELAKRIWSFAQTMDWLYSPLVKISRIPENSYDTNDPLNVDDSDLGFQQFLTEQPPNYFSDMTFCRAKIAICRFSKRAESLPKDPSGWLEYHSILTLSRDMELTIALYEPKGVTDTLLSKRLLHHRSFVLCMLHNKLLRLHRPAFIRSTSVHLYTESRETCSKSATAITEMLCNLRNISPELLRFLYLYGVGAAIIVFIQLLENENKLSEAAQRCTRQLGGLRDFFASTAGSEANTVLEQVSKQCLSLIDGMSLLSWRVLQGRNIEQRLQGVAAIFREIGAMHSHSKQGDAFSGDINPLPVSLGTTNPFDLDSFLLSRPASPTSMMFDWNEFLAGGTRVFFPESNTLDSTAAQNLHNGSSDPRLQADYNKTGINNEFSALSQSMYGN